MSNSDFFDLSLVNYNLAVGYEKIFAGASFYFKNNLFDYVVVGGPGGGSYSTIGDLLKFSMALQQGNLISLKTLEQMTSLKSVSHYGYGMANENIFYNFDLIMKHIILLETFGVEP